MDKRKTQRILGILVIIALVIILFPLLFSKNEVAIQTTSVTAPAFPDKLNTATAVAPVDNQDNQQTTTVTPVAESTPASTNDAIVEIKPEAAPPPVANADAVEPNTAPITNNLQDPKQPTELSNASLDQAKSANTTDEPAKPDVQAGVEQSTISTEEENTAQPVVNKRSLKSTKNKAKTHHKPAHHEVANLNKPAWIVQMGSFKNKANARSLTDKLRAAGFNAFTKEVKLTKGGIRTHVYVGPEFKEASATKISRKIQHDLNLQSIVLPYKPLAL